ncbi:MAG: cell division protein ZapA [Gemmatimonadota bacterium]|nr:MAG: cell division protein ZapA [Gemmatimonadota bacterium]
MTGKGSGGQELVEVEILGETYSLKSETGAEYTRRVAEYVDRTAREIRDESGMMDQTKVAILAALAVTDQLFRMRDGVDVVKGLAEKRAERLTGEVLAAVEQGSAD